MDIAKQCVIAKIKGQNAVLEKYSLNTAKLCSTNLFWKLNGFADQVSIIANRRNRSARALRAAFFSAVLGVIVVVSFVQLFYSASCGINDKISSARYPNIPDWIIWSVWLASSFGNFTVT
jgi:hypothetical protein